MVAFDLLGRRWALRVLWELRGEHLGFRALQERCEGMSSSVLRDRLAELVGADLLETDDAGHYGLSHHGRELLLSLEPMSRWAERWAPGPESTDGSGSSDGPRPHDATATPPSSALLQA